MMNLLRGFPAKFSSANICSFSLIYNINLRSNVVWIYGNIFFWALFCLNVVISEIRPYRVTRLFIGICYKMETKISLCFIAIDIRKVPQNFYFDRFSSKFCPCFRLFIIFKWKMLQWRNICGRYFYMYSRYNSNSSQLIEKYAIGVWLSKEFKWVSWNKTKTTDHFSGKKQEYQATKWVSVKVKNLHEVLYEKNQFPSFLFSKETNTITKSRSRWNNEFFKK